VFQVGFLRPRQRGRRAGVLVFAGVAAMRLCNRLWLFQMLDHSVLWQAKNSWAVRDTLVLGMLVSIAVTVSLLNCWGRGLEGGGGACLPYHATQRCVGVLRR
jgi:hypothetical protein